MAIKLVELSKEYEKQFMEMITEWEEYNKNHPEANKSPSHIFRIDHSNFDQYLIDIKKQPTDPKYAPSTVFFALDEKRNVFVGACDIRHYLTEDLLLTGGHIGDGIRPSERGKGFGTEIVRLALLECKKLGIEKVLITCSEDNPASERTIVNNGGVYENSAWDEWDKEYVKRFWIDISK